jgi:sugar fermentation stimulation protein A
VEYETAMFPDAPSQRALRHLEELAVLSRGDYCCHILFVIVHGNPRVFIPNLHTDPAFAAALSRLRRELRIHAALIGCDSGGNAELRSHKVPLDLSHGRLAEENRGSYMVLLRLPEKSVIETGALGPLSLDSGWYVYAGSAQKNLSRRLARHLRKIKKAKHWHVDYLVPRTDRLAGLPIASYRNLECSLAGDLKKIGGRGVPGFGASDCPSSCGSHLYHFKHDPMENRGFIELLLRYRHREAFIP